MIWNDVWPRFFIKKIKPKKSYPLQPNLSLKKIFQIILNKGHPHTEG